MMFWTKVRVLLAALPAQLAAVQSLLTAVAVEVVPLLPEDLAVRAGAILVVVLGWVATAVAVVSRVTPVSPDARGLVLGGGDQMRVERVGPSFRPGQVPPT